jgi:hypothetical protein
MPRAVIKALQAIHIFEMEHKPRLIEDIDFDARSED